MAKRQASEITDDVMTDSPASKKVRTHGGVDEATTARVNGHARPQPSPGPITADNRGHGLSEANGADEKEEGEEEEDDDEQLILTRSIRQSAPTEGYSDIYLDTINRAVLDFDFEKLCSVTLSNINVYACLVCGKYYQGRGAKSHAYFHALDEDHHVYVNMATKKVYVLPEGYEVLSRSLDDIKFVVDPRLPRAEVLKLDTQSRAAWDLVGRRYVPGFVGMNNIKANDYFNVIVHALAHVGPLRNYLMLEDLAVRPQLAQRFSILVRKIWNPRAFKAHVSPHELLQEVALRSGKRFTLTEQADPVDFLSWFLNHLHQALGGSLKARKKAANALSTSSFASSAPTPTSIVHSVFQGTVKVESQLITARADAGDRLRFEDVDVQTDISPFLILSLDLPPAPLFQHELDQNIIPQVPLTTVLAKYDGVRAQERRNTRLRYRLMHPLPPFLIFHIKRFSVNKFVAERNPTIVTFMPRSLDMAPYVEPNPARQPPDEPIWYDLVANVTHEAIRTRDDSVEGEAERKVWRVQLHDRSHDEWLEFQDLFVEKARAETLFTKESYVQIWERRRAPSSKGKAKA